MPPRSLLRIALSTFVALLIVAAVWLRIPVSSDRTPAADEPEPPPAVRLARDDQPTIVEPNDGWLHTHPQDDSLAGHLPDAPPSTGLLPADAPAEVGEQLNR